MPATTNPELLIAPLAKNAEKNVIPETTGATTGLFSQDLGFQEINSTPLTAGGKAPDRKDFNGVFNLLGGVSFYAQKGWTFHYDATQDYYLGCLVIDPADGKRYECIADMPAGTIAPHSDTDNAYWRRFTLGDGEAVGIIKEFAGNGDIPAGYLLCDGEAYSRTMLPDLFAAIGTTYGAGDGSTTFNVPDYNTAQRFAQGSTVAGVEKEAGLPNITGAVIPTIATTANTTAETVLCSEQAVTPVNNALDTRTGPMANRGYFTQAGTTTSAHSTGISLDASRSNPIYGNSDTVQPNALTTRYIIKAFDGQTADSALIDITQYAQELAGKANITGSNLVHHRDVITTSGTYTAPVTGLYKITVKGGGGGGAGSNSTNSIWVGGGGGGEGGTTIAYEHLTAGDTATIIIGAGGAGQGTGTAGSDGGDSSVTINGTTYTGGGGKGGQANASSNIGGEGGTGTIPGCSGGQGNQGGNSAGGMRGGTGGGNGGAPDNGNNTATNGGGGGGGGYYSNANHGGRYGGDGYVLFEFYTPGT